MSLATETGFVIRPARESDEVAIAALRVALWAECPQFQPAVDEDVDLAMVTREGCLTLVAQVGADVVGWLAFANGESRSDVHTGTVALGVARAHRRMGVGTALLQQLHAWGGAHPLIRRIELRCHAEHAEALRLYTRLGYLAEGLLRAAVLTIDGRHADIVVLSRLTKG